jgi:hypothetical protein
MVMADDDHNRGRAFLEALREFEARFKQAREDFIEVAQTWNRWAKGPPDPDFVLRHADALRESGTTLNLVVDAYNCLPLSEFISHFEDRLDAIEDRAEDIEEQVEDLEDELEFVYGECERNKVEIPDWAPEPQITTRCATVRSARSLFANGIW